MPADEYDELLETVRKALTKPQWAVVSMRLKYGNEPTQKQRLDHMIDSAGEPIAPLVASFRKFSRRVIDRRNELTHGGEDAASPSISNHHMVWAKRCLEVVFVANLLKELSYTDTEVKDFIEASPSWKSVKWPGNTWIGEALGNL